MHSNSKGAIAKVSCPCCSRLVEENLINRHLDTCLTERSLGIISEKDMEVQKSLDTFVGSEDVRLPSFFFLDLNTHRVIFGDKAPLQ